MTRLKLHAHDPGKSALFKIKQLSEKCPAVTKGETHANIQRVDYSVIKIKIRTVTLIALLISFRRSYFVYPAYL